MRIRSIKPEFWTSTAISSLAIEDRLLFIGLWSYVDDNGVGLDRLSLIATDLFPDDVERDPRDTFARVQRGLSNLSEAGRIARYAVENRDYLAIANWSEHQRIDKPAKARYPLPTRDDAVIRDTLATPSRDLRETPSTGAGEQGNRGTGEQTSSSPIADAIREDVEALCEHLASRIEGNGSKQPTVGKLWRDQARLLLDLDKRTPEEAHRLIDWCQDDAFWMANIQSMAKFRQKFDQLRLQSQRAAGAATPEPKSAAEQAWGPRPEMPAWLFDRGDEDAS